jgi:hypothetical protein
VPCLQHSGILSFAYPPLTRLPYAAPRCLWTLIGTCAMAAPKSDNPATNMDQTSFTFPHVCKKVSSGRTDLRQSNENEEKWRQNLKLIGGSRSIESEHGERRTVQQLHSQHPLRNRVQLSATFCRDLTELPDCRFANQQHLRIQSRVWKVSCLKSPCNLAGAHIKIGKSLVKPIDTCRKAAQIPPDLHLAAGANHLRF